MPASDGGALPIFSLIGTLLPCGETVSLIFLEICMRFENIKRADEYSEEEFARLSIEEMAYVIFCIPDVEGE